MKQEQGITLIALVITIIVLLILAAVSIATLTGENGILNQVNKAQKNTDIAETKEQIELEIMGTVNEDNTSYTNQDVINAVEKITGIEVEENTATVKSKKGNNVDISDLWKKLELEEETKYYFTINDIQCYFTNKDAGFQYNSSGKASFYYDEWINNHVSGLSCTPISGEFYQIVDEKAGFIDMIDYHTLRSEGSAITLYVNNLESRIHYDN